MADKSIDQLSSAAVMNSNDLFVISQGGQAKKVSWETFYQYLSQSVWAHGGIDDVTYTAPASGSLNGTMVITFGDGTMSEPITITNGRGINSISKTGTSGLTDTYTISYNNGTTSTFQVVNGRSITGITWNESGTSGDGRTHTGTISYNDGTTSTVVLRDGFKGDTGAAWYVHIKYANTEPTSDSDMSDEPADWIGVYSGTSITAPTDHTEYQWFQYKGDQGDAGNGIVSVSKVGTSGLVDTYGISFADGSITTFDITNGSSIDTITLTSTEGRVKTYTVTLTDGSASTFDVTDGKSIVSIQQTGGTHAQNTEDEYTITYNDGDIFTFRVYNGADGQGTVSTVAGIGVSPNSADIPLILKGNGAPTQNTVGQENQLYFDMSSGVMYICLGESGGLYNWVGTSVRIDSALSTTSERPVQNAVITAKVGTAALNTTAQNLSGAINEHESDLTALDTDVQTLSDSVDDLSDALESFVESEKVSPNIGMFPVVGVIGDSFASGYASVNGSATNHYDYSWGQILARKYGNRCINYSRGGYTTAAFVDTTESYYNTRGLGALVSDCGNSNKPALYLMCLGINDAGQDMDMQNIGSSADIKTNPEQNADTFWGRYGKIVQIAKANNANAKIIFCTFSRRLSGREQVYAAYNNAIRGLATYFSQPCADLETEEYFTSDFYFNQMVSAHPTLLGYSAYADGMDRLLSKVLRINTAVYNDYAGQISATYPSNHLILNSKNIVIDNKTYELGVAPSSAVSSNYIAWRDKNSESSAQVRYQYNTNGYGGIRLAGGNVADINGTPTKKWNVLDLLVKPNGDPFVSLSADAKTAWLDALGIDWSSGFAGIYTDYSSLGFSAKPTMKAYAQAMPDKSIAMLTENYVDQTGMTLPDGANAVISVVVIFKYANTRMFAIGARAYSSISEKNANLYIASWNTSDWIGWKKLVAETNNGYLAGDSITFSSGFINVLSGFAANSTIIRFMIPLSQRILAAKASVSGKIRLRADGQNVLVTLGTGNTVATYVTEMGVGVALTFSANHGFAANTAVPVTIEGTDFTVTFSDT